MSVRPLFISIGLTAFTGCSLLVDTSDLTGGPASSPGSDGGGSTDGSVLVDGATSGDGQANDGGDTRPLVLLSAGGNSTCALIREKLLCWGANDRFQLGDGTKAQRNAPVAVKGLPIGTISALGVGETHACAIVGGDVLCWGDGGEGQLGDGQKTDSAVPVKVTGLPGAATSVCGGSDFSCAVAKDDAYCWGVNNRGQIGGEIGPLAGTPVRVSYADANGPGPMAEVSCGQDHVCGRSKSGDIWCWGHNDNGTLGSPTVDNGAPVYKAVKVVGLPAPAEHLSMAGWHACVTLSGAAWCWGTGDNGELGNGAGLTSTQPVAVSGLVTGVTAVATGGGATDGDSTCAIQNGGVHCWGHGQRGRLGDGANNSRKAPYALPTLTANVTTVAAGYLHACAVIGDEIRCWGAGDLGQLGDDGATDRPSPVSVKLPAQ